MKKIIPVTDLQRQAGQILNSLSDSDEPVIVTQRGRASAVIISAERYTRIEEDLERLDELELSELVKRAREARAAGDTISHLDVKKRFGVEEREPKQQRSSRRGR
jgi:prevent-host-death family protein